MATYDEQHVFLHLAALPFEVEVPEEWTGKTVGGLDIRKRYNINILAVKKEGEFTISISPDTCFAENNKLLVLGEYRDLQKCFRI